jgi:hypothetical protein
MALELHFGDKLLPGLFESVGVKTEVKPAVKVRFAGGSEIPHVLTRLDTTLWKIRFKLAQDAKGEVEVEVKAGNDSKTEKKAIG